MVSPWLFNIHMNGVIREVNVRVLGKCLNLIDADDKDVAESATADDTALVADSKEKLCQLVEEFGKVCRRK